MGRSFVMSTLACALALAPALVFAQTAPPQTTPPQTAPAAPAQPAEPKVSFASPAGILLVQIKPTETATFEEMMGKLQAGLAKTTDATLKQQTAGFKVFKAAEAFGPNALYVVSIEPTIPGAEYELFAMLQKTMTDDEKRAAHESKLWEKYAAAFATGLNRLSLTPVAAK